ncbi:MAG: hypothetical protein Q9159_002250 [Coniocarpon cinnabarinum]
MARLRIVLVSLLRLAISEPLVHNARNDVSYQGTNVASLDFFDNVKFAQDTSGANRFAPPQPFDPIPGTTVNATVPGPACPQLTNAVPPFFGAYSEVSEDCLNLRIVRPSGTTSSARLPVLVWLHGGGVVRGSAYDEHFNPQRLVELSATTGSPVIFVAIQHRLNIFGFARLESLEESHSLNAGFRDQRFAFEWLKDNIAAFGGDPSRITAIGHSAGGTFLSLQHFAYGGEQGLPFDQAWTMSGPPGTALNMSSDATTIHTKAVAERVGCAASLGADKTLDCLRQIPMDELLAKATDYAVAYHPPMGLFTFIPSVDDDILPDRPSVLLREGRFVKGVPAVLGWTHDDGAMNAGPAPLINSKDDTVNPLKNFATGLNSEQVSALLDKYKASDFEDDATRYNLHKGVEDPSVSSQYFATSRLLRDMLFTCPSIYFTYQAMKRTQMDKTHKSWFKNVRLYDLNQSTLNPIWNHAGMPWIGASHGSDLSYLFNHFPEGELNNEDRELARHFAGSVLSFAHNADPVLSSGESRTFRSWPEAYDVISDERDLMPTMYNVLLIGGQHKSIPVHISNTTASGRQERAATSLLHSNYENQRVMNLEFGKLQEVVSNALGFAAANDSQVDQAVQALRSENLFERCACINNLADALEN